MTVTAKELREFLKDVPDKMIIVLQTDDEGNGYRYMRGLETYDKGPKSNHFDKKTGEMYRREDLKESGLKIKDVGPAVVVVY